MVNSVFQDLFEESFPAASPEIRARFKSFLASQRSDYKWFFAPSLREHLSQGDIIVNVPAFFFNGSEVKISRERCPVILLEHTCDMAIDEGKARNQHYTFAPLLPFDKIKEKFKQSSDLVYNKISHKLFVGNVPRLGQAYVVDLDLCGSLDSEWVHAAIQNGELSRISSLSHNGYFFFLAKLTAHFLRADSSFLLSVA